MRIFKINIENFRSIKKLDYYPADINLIIGGNNSGKTTIFKALDFCLNPYIQWYRFSFTEFDFYKRKTDLPIIFGLVFVLDRDEYDIAPYFEEHLEVMDPLEQFLPYEGFEEAFSSNNRLALRIRLECDRNYIPSTFYQKPESNKKKVSRDEKEKIGFLYIPANRDPLHELAFYQNSMFSKLLGKYDLSSNITKIVEKMKESQPVLDENLEFKKSFEQLRTEIAKLKFIKDDTEAMKLNILNLSDQKVLQSLNLVLRGINTDTDIPIEMQGSGMQDAILISTIFRIISEDKNQNLVLAFEEPEHNLEPYYQRLIAKRLQKPDSKRFQLFVSSHSPDIISAFPLDSIGIIQVDTEKHSIISVAKCCSPVDLKFFERYERNQLLQSFFARHVLLVEGSAERGGLPIYLDALQGKTLKSENDVIIFEGLEALGIELIDCGGFGEIHKYASFLRNLKFSVIGIVDNDRSPEELKKITNSCNLTVIFPEDSTRNTFEKVLLKEANIAKLIEGINICAEEYLSWNPLRNNIYPYFVNKSDLISAENLEKIKSAESFKQWADILVMQLDQNSLRKILYFLIAHERAPLYCKSVRQNRIIAQALVTNTDEVPKSFVQIAAIIEKIVAGKIIENVCYLS
jgi:predicted ATP-dependent endonuclease of OLD family